MTSSPSTVRGSRRRPDPRGCTVRHSSTRSARAGRWLPVRWQSSIGPPDSGKISLDRQPTDACAPTHASPSKSQMRQRFVAAVALTALVLTWTARLGGVQTPASRSPSNGDLTRLEAIEPLVRRDIEQKRLPGAVVLIGVGDRVVYQKAIGDRALVPAREPMTLDTIFDLASLTKIVATTTSVMMLIEQGRVRLIDRVSSFIPGFERYGKADITVRHLLTHVSGLRPDVGLRDAWTGADTAIALAIEEVPTSPPGTRFVYSDINFFLLGEIVRRVSGQRLDEFAQQRVFT